MVMGYRSSLVGSRNRSCIFNWVGLPFMCSFLKNGGKSTVGIKHVTVRSHMGREVARKRNTTPL